MSDDSSANGLTIPDDTAAKFPDVLKLIQGSESMNLEERQYWINILPVMTPEQLQNLVDILESEKKKLAAIDKKYEKKLSPEEEKKQIETTEAELRRRREERTKEEQSFEQKDEKASENLLKKIEEL